MFELAIMARSGAWTAHHTTLGVRGAPGARELSSQVIGIVGFGNIGRMVARNLAGFRCEFPSLKWPLYPCSDAGDCAAYLQARSCTTTAMS